MRLIDAYKIDIDRDCYDTYADYIRAFDTINEAPTVDAVPVRHGKWIDMDEQSYTWKVRCSVCGHERSMLSTQGTYPNYCENCGARMDAERKEDDKP